MLIEVYRNKLISMLMKAKHLKQIMTKNNIQFDPRNIEDPEYQASQIIVGRSMMNMLEYIKQNYQTHFKDVKI